MRFTMTLEAGWLLDVFDPIDGREKDQLVWTVFLFGDEENITALSLKPDIALASLINITVQLCRAKMRHDLIPEKQAEVLDGLEKLYLGYRRNPEDSINSN